jgi:predicted phosphodiesterase
MKIAVLGDIHSNSNALESVLADIKNENIDKIVHTGDVVGYCTDIEECIERLVTEEVIGVCGNHDLMAIGEMGTDDCVRSGVKAIHWTWNHITGGQKEYLASLPKTKTIENIVLFHATPSSVVQRIVKPADAADVAQELNEVFEDWWVGIHGHVHKQRIFECDGDDVVLAHTGQGSFILNKRKRYIVCPGSVGVSRDFDPRSAYMLIDTDSSEITMKRIEYDWHNCEKRIRKAGLETQLYLKRRTYLNRKIRYIVGSIIRNIKMSAKVIFN